MNILTTSDLYQAYESYPDIQIQKTRFIDFAGGSPYLARVNILENVRMYKTLEEMNISLSKENWLILTANKNVPEFTLSARSIVFFLKNGYKHILINGYLADKIYLDEYIKEERKKNKNYEANVFARGKNIFIPPKIPSPSYLLECTIDEFQYSNDDFLCIDSDGMIKIPALNKARIEEIKKIVEQIILQYQNE